jgi:hypothetical protein
MPIGSSMGGSDGRQKWRSDGDHPAEKGDGPQKHERSYFLPACLALSFLLWWFIL